MEFVIVLTVCSDLKTVKLEGFKNLNYKMQHSSTIDEYMMRTPF